LNSKILYPLLYTVAVLLFNIINWYGAKNTSTFMSTVKYAIMTLPIQLSAYILLVQGFNIAYREYHNFYTIIITSITISWFAKITTVYLFDQKLPTTGQLIALILLIVANFAEKIIK